MTEESSIENEVIEVNKTTDLEPVVPETQQELLEASKVLLTKLTMLTVGENGLDKIPGLLQQLFAGFGRFLYILFFYIIFIPFLYFYI